jgi:hypothetical protein
LASWLIMSKYLSRIGLWVWLLTSTWSLANAQDFILQGCYWDCPDDGAPEIDPASFSYWVEHMQAQASQIGHAGFSYLWLPAAYPEQQARLGELIRALRRQGINTIADINMRANGADSASLDWPLRQVEQWRRQMQVSGFRIVHDAEISPDVVGALLNQLHAKEQTPNLLAIRTLEKKSPQKMAAWVNALLNALTPEAEREVDARVFDYPLREALRRACLDPTYDTRQIFGAGIRDATALSGYKIVTFVNSPEFYRSREPGETTGLLLEDPMLAYAYVLTNNQLGLPAVFYGDYFGAESEIEYYLDKAPLRESIDQLIKVHREYIFNSIEVEYLNRLGAERAAHYLSGDPKRALIFQMDGGNTPAGRAAKPKGRDVLIAINFSEAPLQVIQEINMANLGPGDRFSDVLGRSNAREMVVGAFPEHGVGNAVLIDLPPRSYSVWVQGQAEPVLAGPIDFQASLGNQCVELNWEVADERRFLSYLVERSVNGRPYEKIAMLFPRDAAGKGAAYLHVDEDVFPGEKISYRIRARTGEERFENSAVKTVTTPPPNREFEVIGDADLKIVRIHSHFQQQATLTLFNTKGEKVFSRQENLRRGVNQVSVDMRGLPKGVYYLKFNGGSRKEWTRRIVLL